MPNARRSRIPSYRLYKPTGLAVVRLKGRDFYLGKHCTPEMATELDGVTSLRSRSVVVGASHTRLRSEPSR